MKKISVFILVLFCIGIFACSSDKKDNTALKIYTVKAEKIEHKLYFTGTINPIRETIITNPMDGVVKSFNYYYGQKVDRNNIVFSISSETLQNQFNTVLTEYLKAKDNFQNAKTKFLGTQALWKEGLVARNNYISDESSLKHLRIAFLDARHKLLKIIEKIENVKFEDIENLSFSDFEKIRLTLLSDHNLLNLKASTNGVLLYPPLQDDKIAKVTVGSAVKAGQALALIGDMSGIKVEIDIPEVEISKVKTGQSAIVKTTAFMQDALYGRIVAINSQASNNAGSSLPTFSAIVEVDNLSDEQKQKLKVGMSAQIELIIDTQDKILIPREAISNENGQSIVKVQNKSGDLQVRVVQTHSVENNKIVISKGLNAGEQIVLS